MTIFNVQSLAFPHSDVPFGCRHADRIQCARVTVGTRRAQNLLHLVGTLRVCMFGQRAHQHRIANRSEPPPLQTCRAGTQQFLLRLPPLVFPVPGSKNFSMPRHLSVIRQAPAPAASKTRVGGEKPTSAIESRLIFSAILADALMRLCDPVPTWPIQRTLAGSALAAPAFAAKNKAHLRCKFGGAQEESVRPDARDPAIDCQRRPDHRPALDRGIPDDESPDRARCK